MRPELGSSSRGPPSDGAVWVTSVENRYVAGALTRIPVEPSRRASHAPVFPRRPTLALAVGSGVTWVLVGPWASLHLVGVDQRTRRASSHPIRHDVGWIAADNTGLTPGLFGVAGDGDVLRIAPDGSTQPKIHPARMEIVARTRLLGSLGGLSFGNGALWTGRSGPSVGVLRIEPRTLRSRLFATFP